MANWTIYFFMCKKQTYENNQLLGDQIYPNNVLRTFKYSTSISSLPQLYITDSQNDQLPVGFNMLTAQLVEHCTNIAEVISSNPLKPDFFSSFLFIAALIPQ